MPSYRGHSWKFASISKQETRAGLEIEKWIIVSFPLQFAFLSQHDCTLGITFWSDEWQIKSSLTFPSICRLWSLAVREVSMNKLESTIPTIYISCVKKTFKFENSSCRTQSSLSQWSCFERANKFNSSSKNNVTQAKAWCITIYLSIYLSADCKTIINIVSNALYEHEIPF